MITILDGKKRYAITQNLKQLYCRNAMRKWIVSAWSTHFIIGKEQWEDTERRQMLSPAAPPRGETTILFTRRTYWTTAISAVPRQHPTASNRSSQSWNQLRLWYQWRNILQLPKPSSLPKKAWSFAIMFSVHRKFSHYATQMLQIKKAKNRSVCIWAKGCMWRMNG